MTSKTRSGNRIWIDRTTLGDPLGTPWEPPRDPGLKVDDSEVDFEVYFDSQSMKSETKVSPNQRSGVPEGHIQAILPSLTSSIDLNGSQSLKTALSFPNNSLFKISMSKIQNCMLENSNLTPQFPNLKIQRQNKIYCMGRGMREVP